MRRRILTKELPGRNSRFRALSNSYRLEHQQRRDAVYCQVYADMATTFCYGACVPRKSPKDTDKMVVVNCDVGRTIRLERMRTSITSPGRACALNRRAHKRVFTRRSSTVQLLQSPTVSCRINSDCMISLRNHCGARRAAQTRQVA